jgi:hypothetical protein
VEELAKMGGCFSSQCSVELLGVNSDASDIGSCTEDTESLDATGLPYMLDKDPDDGLVEGIASYEFEGPSVGLRS